jgi:hypothetical protein
MRRRCAALATTASIKPSACSTVFPGPSENRTLDRASSGVSPIASSTCEGSTAPLEHADPLDTA